MLKAMNPDPILPFPRTWWIAAGRIIGGPYPGDPDRAVAERKLTALLDAGVRRVICLQEENERGRDGRPFIPYMERLQELAASRGLPFVWSRHPITDMCTPDLVIMREILDAIDTADGVVYLHCWGGHGRTGTVAGCWLREQGMTAEVALAQITTARAHDDHLRNQVSPQTAAQIRMVREWPARDRDPVAVSSNAPTAPAQKAASVPEMSNRVRGILLGLAVGDALGTTLEFSRPKPSSWVPPVRGPHTNITGGGPFRVKPGQITDDTQLATCLATTLAEFGAIELNPQALKALADRYSMWRKSAFDIGNQTAASLSAYAAYGDPRTSGLRAWKDKGGKAAGNGALMRAAPIGALVADSKARVTWAVADALITHADPRCILANIAFVQAIAEGVRGGTASTMFSAARSALGPGQILAATMVDFGEGAAALWKSAESDLNADLDSSTCCDPWLYEELEIPDTWGHALQEQVVNDIDRYRLGMVGSWAGFVRVAFRLAFWQLLHAHDLAGALVDTVNRGGDADTNGAIVGALLGARDGAASIPAAWVDVVLNCNPAEPWNRMGKYHPRAMLAAAEVRQRGQAQSAEGLLPSAAPVETNPT
jgi:ADP-ribosylglycohydrolase